MDSDAVIGLLMIAFWVVTSLLSRFGRKMRPPAESYDPEEADETLPQQVPREMSLEEALRQMAQLGKGKQEESPYAEAPVHSEHTETASEHRQTAIEIQETASEHTLTESEHRRTASEIRHTPSEKSLPKSEHVWTNSEHQRGEVRRLRPVVGGRRSRRQRSVLAAKILQDLSSGPHSLGRAVVLKEILGPPVSLRSTEP